MRKFVIAVVIVCAVLIGLVYIVADMSTPKAPDGPDIDDAAQESSLAAQPDERTMVSKQAASIVRALSKRNMPALAELVHPKQGVRFSPYAYVSEDDLVFTADQVAAFSSDATQYTWGSFDGSGEPITMAPAEYFTKFVYSRDFASSPDVHYDEDWYTGNTSDNAREVYPLGVFVDYHMPPYAKPEDTMDWADLRLVFDEYEGDWYLTGVIHNQWTI